MRVSVIVPAYNAANTLGDCLAALLDQSVGREQYEVIVVDDGSTDRTAELARARGVQVIRQEQRGAAAARNRGAHQARGETLLFTDADCQPAHDWIEKMLAPFARDEVAGAKGVYRTKQRGLIPRFVQLEYESKYRHMARWQYIDFVDTYSAAYRREVFLASGGFDERFPAASVEDQELSFRLTREGHRLIFQPEATVIHHHVGSVARYFRRKFWIGYWKVLVHVEHPAQVWSDSHTPQLLKLQVGLMGLAGLALVIGLWQAVGLLAAGLLLALLVLSTWPFALWAARRDLEVALISPALILVRALGLGSGLAVGLAAQVLRTLQGRR